MTVTQAARFPVSELPRGLREVEEFQPLVIQAAKWYGWIVHHGRPARTKDGWKTPIQGLAGFPDLVLARQGRVIFAELKTDRAKPTPNQQRWLAELGALARLWRPADWPEILRELGSPARQSPSR